MPLCVPNTKNESRSSSLSKSAMGRQLKRLQQRNDIFRFKLDNLQQRFLELKNRLRDSTCELENVKAESTLRSAMEQPAIAPLIYREMPMPGFQFNLTTIAAAIELGKRVGFRAAADVMKIVFDMLGIEIKVPSHDAIEQWTLRLGVALLKDTFSKGERVL